MASNTPEGFEDEALIDKLVDISKTAGALEIFVEECDKLICGENRYTKLSLGKNSYILTRVEYETRHNLRQPVI